MTIGECIGHYRIVEQIGVGGMGLVYLGEHMLLGRRAAIKTLQPKHSVHAELVERFFNEARAASAISDPGIVQIFDFGYHVDGTAYIVMELLEGEALSDRIDRLGALSLGETLRIARQAAGSLAAAHTHSIVHRDLKPENIYLVADTEAQGGERTKLLDFGICKVSCGDASLTDAGIAVGTPAYMAPEQCRGLGDIDHRADIYAFGCLMFHMLTGRTPFEAAAPGDFLIAHVQHVPPPPSAFVDVPPEVDAVVLRCLAKAPEARFATMAELQAAIGDVAAQLGMAAAGTPTATRTLAPIGTPPPPRIEELASIVDEPIVQRRPWRAVAGIVLAGVVAAGAAIYVASSAEDDHADVPAFVAAEAASAPEPEPAPPPPPPPIVAPIVDAPKPPAAPPVAQHSHRAVARHAQAASPEDLYDTR